MSQFLGEIESKLDAKGRLKFPSRFIRQMDAVDDGRFVISRGLDSCLMLYPESEWKKLSEKVDELNPFVKEHRDFKRQFYNGAVDLHLDNSDRLLLPKKLFPYAGITKEVVLFGSKRFIEVWDKEKFMASTNMDPEEFSELAQSIWSGRKEEE